MAKKMYKAAVLAVIAFVVPSLLSCGGDGPKIKKTPAGYAAYADEVNHFKLAHPDNWRLTAFKSQGGCNLSMPVSGALFVKTRKAYDSESMDRLRRNFKARLKLWGDKLVMHKEKSTTLSGKSAQLYVYTMNGNYPKTQYVIFALAGGRYYELIFDGKPDAFNTVKNRIQTVVDTFHITK